MSSTNQRGRPTPGTGSGTVGTLVTRQRVAAAVGWPKSEASAARRQRRMAKPMVPVLSAASCRRREAVIESRADSEMTPPRDRKSDVWGKGGLERDEIGGSGNIKK